MNTQTTDRLIADVLAMSLDIRRHLEDGRRPLTPIQIDALSNAITSIANYFAAWKAHHVAGRQRRGEKGNRKKSGSAGVPIRLTQSRRS